jgi:glyoxylase-like metal-dependent hydrolase (beta-lactamase superfamily II)
MLHVVKAGALTARPATRARAWDAATLRSLPGRPEAILIPGHTPGNAAILIPTAGAIAVGDSFASSHPLTRKTGPQMLHRMYHSDPDAALEATRRLDGVHASVVLPGHGPALRMPLAEALAALRRGETG